VRIAVEFGKLIKAAEAVGLLMPDAIPPLRASAASTGSSSTVLLALTDAVMPPLAALAPPPADVLVIADVQQALPNNINVEDAFAGFRAFGRSLERLWSRFLLLMLQLLARHSWILPGLTMLSFVMPKLIAHIVLWVAKRLTKTGVQISAQVLDEISTAFEEALELPGSGPFNATSPYGSDGHTDILSGVPRWALFLIAVLITRRPLAAAPQLI
jgi:hypothetical protein